MWMVKNSIRLKSELGLQLWKTWIKMQISMRLGKVLYNTKTSVMS